MSAAERRKLEAIVAQPDVKQKMISLVGFTDRSGSGDYNQLLSTRRVAVVREVLLSLGMPGALIATANGLGEMGLPVATRDGVIEKENRVVFVFGAQ